MKVKLYYFYPNGSQFHEGEYETEKIWDFEIMSEVNSMRKYHQLPGLEGAEYEIQVMAETEKGLRFLST